MFQVLYRLYIVPEMMNVFWGYFVLSFYPWEKGWWYFIAHHGFTLTKEAPSSVHSWKEKFFFIDIDPAWGIPIDWAILRRTPNGFSSPSGEEKKGIEVLKQLVFEQQLTLMTSLLFEDMLVNVGLSSMLVDGEFGYVFGITFSFHLF